MLGHPHASQSPSFVIHMIQIYIFTVSNFMESFNYLCFFLVPTILLLGALMFPSVYLYMLSSRYTGHHQLEQAVATTVKYYSQGSGSGGVPQS